MNDKKYSTIKAGFYPSAQFLMNAPLSDNTTTTISLYRYVARVLGLYPRYREQSEQQQWNHLYLFPVFPPTDEAMIIEVNNRTLEERVVEELPSLSTLPLALLSSDVFRKWAEMVESTDDYYKEFIATQLKNGMIKRVGGGRVSYLNEETAALTAQYPDNLDYITLVVSQVLDSFHGFVDEIVFHEDFNKPLVSTLYDAKIEGALLQQINREVFNLLAKEYIVGSRRFLQLDVEQLANAEKYFLLYKSVHTENVSLDVFDREYLSSTWEPRNPHGAVLRTRQKIAKTVLDQCHSQPEEIIRFFELLLSDTTVPESYLALDSESMRVNYYKFRDQTDPVLVKGFCDVCVKVVTDESRGCLATKEIAISYLIRQKDLRIVGILKALFRDELAPLHDLANENIFPAIEEMPDKFPEPEFDEHKIINRDFVKNHVLN